MVWRKSAKDKDPKKDSIIMTNEKGEQFAGAMVKSMEYMATCAKSLPTIIDRLHALEREVEALKKRAILVGPEEKPEP